MSIVEEFASLYQVASDCRPWHSGGSLAVCQACGLIQKPVTDEWLRQVADIYRGYEIYFQGGGAETIIFDRGAGAGDTRSGKILRWLEKHASLPETGSLLDVGCGTGSFLREFGKQHPSWTLAGSEYDDKHKQALESIPGVERVHVGDPADIREQFDLVVMIHSLEHIPDARNYLQKLAGLLKPGGALFIDVPDMENSPFDMLIADHCSHYTWSTLNRIVDAAGLERVGGQQDAIPKEMFCLSRKVAGVAAPDRPALQISSEELDRQTRLAHSHCAWLRAILTHAETLSDGAGIFGSSISATWLATSLGERAAFFVDEDLNRHGRSHAGRPIYGVADAPREQPILIPLRRDIAASVAARLAETGLQFVLPPQQ